MIVNLVYSGVPLSIEGEYFKAEQAEFVEGYPGSPETFEIHHVWLEGCDISPLLSDDTIKDISQLILETLN